MSAHALVKNVLKIEDEQPNFGESERCVTLILISNTHLFCFASFQHFYIAGALVVITEKGVFKEGGKTHEPKSRQQQQQQLNPLQHFSKQPSSLF